jgi:hypothetical protein
MRGYHLLFSLRCLRLLFRFLLLRYAGEWDDTLTRLDEGDVADGRGLQRRIGAEGARD